MTVLTVAATNLDVRVCCLQGMSKNDSSGKLYHGSPYISKLESISSSAVRAADKVGASLIVVYTHTGELHGFATTERESSYMGVQSPS
jgi:pyruvate kinase